MTGPRDPGEGPPLDAPHQLPLVVSGILRGGLTGILTGLAIIGGLALYALVAGDGEEEGFGAVPIFATIAALVGCVVGAALGFIVALVLTPFRNRLGRVGPWAGLVALTLAAPSMWWWWFSRNELPFDFDRDAGAVLALPLATAALTAAAAWTVPGGQQRPRPTR